jgi:hypothetical protein
MTDAHWQAGDLGHGSLGFQTRCRDLSVWARVATSFGPSSRAAFMILGSGVAGTVTPNQAQNGPSARPLIVTGQDQGQVG